jgi:hypothetical protein
VIVYLLGHSGVGKSNAIGLLGASRLDISVIDIDEELQRRFVDDWTIVGARLASIQSDARLGHAVVDLGAGYQHNLQHQLIRVFREVDAFVVVVTAPPEEVIRRQPVQNRSMDEFIQTEYTSRKDLFSCARCTIDVGGLNEDESARRVADELLRIFDSRDIG